MYMSTSLFSRVSARKPPAISCPASTRHFLPGLGQLLKAGSGESSLRRTQRWQRIVPHRRSTIFRAVADVEEYADFLPWCLSSRVLERSDGETSGETELQTEITVGYQALKSTLSSRVTVSPMTRVHSESAANEYVEQLSFTWDFQDIGEQTCRLEMCAAPHERMPLRDAPATPRLTLCSRLVWQVPRL